MTDQVIEAAPNPLAAILHATWAEEMRACPHGIHLGGPHAGEPYAMCEVFAKAITPIIVSELIPDLIRTWADTFDQIAAEDEETMWVQSDPEGEQPEESFEGHIARHIALDMETAGLSMPAWRPVFDDHPLPPLPDGGL